MKKLFLITLGTCLLILSACFTQSGSPSASSSDAAETTAASPTATHSASASGTADATAVTAPPSSGSIIAESSNAVSDKEKQAILNDLSNQLDAAFSGTQDMEDLDDSDLDTNNIQ